MDDGTTTGGNVQPTNNAGDGDELARLRKERDQAIMRANQLSNEAEARKKAEDEAAEAKLKENAEFKTLYEQEKARRDELEAATKQEKAQAGLKSATEELLGTYSAEVRELADAAGITLTEATDEAKAEFKSRLDAVASKVRPSASPIRGNNAPPQTNAEPNREDQLKRMRAGDKTATSSYIGNLSGVKAMRQMAGIEPPQS